MERVLDSMEEGGERGDREKDRGGVREKGGGDKLGVPVQSSCLESRTRARLISLVSGTKTVLTTIASASFPSK